MQYEEDGVLIPQGTTSPVPALPVSLLLVSSGRGGLQKQMSSCRPRLVRAQQIGDRKASGELWQGSHDLVFTTKYGTPIEPGNMTRMFAPGLAAPGSGSSRSGTRGSLLVALKVHPKVAQRIFRH